MNTKYKIEIIQGCTAFDTVINGVSVVDIPENEKEEVVNYLIDQMKESYKRGEVTLESLIENFQYDDYEHDPEPCSQCGDTISKTVYIV
jgi:formamidopyrimidine-DNA glycosylase